LIASTPTSTIFGVIGDKNSIVKVVRNDYFLKNEIRMLNKLQRHVIDKGIIKLVKSSNTVMMLQP
jgi:hypothetical protein